MTTRFTGKTAIVTGASRGIGLGIARQLVDEGARVVITARNQAEINEAVEYLGGAEHALGVAGAADNAAHQEETVQRAIDVFGSADLLVNNAGINLTIGPLVEADLGAARKTFEVNGIAALAWTTQVHRTWMQEHGGAIVNMSSMAAVRPAAGVGLYGASKALLAYLTEQLALELGPNVRVNAVAPAVVKTKFSSPLYEGREEKVAAGYPLKRLGEPSDIASVVAFLLSDEASWITGQQIVIDGGVTLAGVRPDSAEA